MAVQAGKLDHAPGVTRGTNAAFGAVSSKH